MKKKVLFIFMIAFLLFVPNYKVNADDGYCCVYKNQDTPVYFYDSNFVGESGAKTYHFCLGGGCLSSNLNEETLTENRVNIFKDYVNNLSSDCSNLPDKVWYVIEKKETSGVEIVTFYESNPRLLFEYSPNPPTISSATLSPTETCPANITSGGNSGSSNVDPGIGDGEIDWGDKVDENCDGIIGQELIDFINKIFRWIQIIAPIFVIIMGGVEFAGAILQDDKDALKKASSKFMKRLIIAVALFFIPLIISWLLEIFNGVAGANTSTCGIGE